MPHLILLFGLAIRFYQVFQSGFNQLIFESGDSRFNNFIIEWVYQRISHWQIKGIWSPPFFYPTKDVLAYSDNLFGDVLFYAPWRLLGLDPWLAFQCWMICCFILSYYSGYFVIKRLGFLNLYAAIGAFLFAFSLPILGQIDHGQLLPLFPIPIIFYCLYRFVESPGKRKYAAMFFFMEAWQFYCGIYLGFFTALMAAIFFVTAVKIHKRQLNSFFNLPNLALFVVLFSIPVGLLLYPYYQCQGQVGGRLWGEVVSMLPTIRSYVLPNDGSIYSWVLSQAWTIFPMRHEHWIFIGVLPTLLFLMALRWAVINWRSCEPVFKISLITSCVMILITYNFWGVSLWWFIYEFIPGFRAIRAVTRYQCVNIFFITVVIVCYLRAAGFFQKRIGLLLIPLLCVDLWGTPPYRMTHDELVQRVERIKKNVEANELFVVNPYGADDDDHHAVIIDAMWAAMQKGAYTVNGYSGRENEIHSMLFVMGQMVCPRLQKYVQPVLLREHQELSILYLSPIAEQASILNCTEKLYERDGVIKLRYKGSL